MESAVSTLARIDASVESIISAGFCRRHEVRAQNLEGKRAPEDREVSEGLIVLRHGHTRACLQTAGVLEASVLGPLIERAESGCRHGNQSGRSAQLPQRDRRDPSQRARAVEILAPWVGFESGGGWDHASHHGDKRSSGRGGPDGEGYAHRVAETRTPLASSWISTSREDHNSRRERGQTMMRFEGTPSPSAPIEWQR